MVTVVVVVKMSNIKTTARALVRGDLPRKKPRANVHKAFVSWRHVYVLPDALLL
jgi:hypothetical protein